MRFSNRIFCVRRTVLLALFAVSSILPACKADAAQWYKAALHAHSSWSDGQELPELAAHWYKTNGYNFMVFTDHDTAMETDTWKTIGTTYVPEASVERAAALFGPTWNTLNGDQIKLKTFNQVKAKLDQPGSFLLAQGEELTSTLNEGKPNAAYVHVNAWNIPATIPCATGATSAAIINGNLAAVAAVAERSAPLVLAQVNHPNAGPNATYAVSAEDIAQSSSQFMEVCNACPDTYYHGDSTHPSTEKIWDIANTIRVGAMRAAPLYGTGTDDAHIYTEISKFNANPGRAWTMVRAETLSADAVFSAMTKGDFYATTGVELDALSFDPGTHTLTVAVKPEAGVNYHIDFIGTPKGVDPTRQPDGTYSSEIGTVMKSVDGTSASYTMTGAELYIRAHIYSDKTMENPSYAGVNMEQAWTQPIVHTPEPSTIALATCGLLSIGVYRWKTHK
jgi:hypothetical protein